MYVPDIYCSKDISDLIKNRGLATAQQLIKDEIWKMTNNSESTISYIDVPF